MRLMIAMLIMMFAANIVFAQMPAVSENVPVVQSGDPARCDSSWTGKASRDEVSRMGVGQNYGLSGPTVRSCQGCAMVEVNQTQTCVCKTCYDYFQ